MNIFEGTWFSKKKEEKKEITVPENLPVEEKEEIVPRTPKTVQDISNAKDEIFALQDKNEQALTALREQKRIARELGVNEFKKDGHTRTDTFRELIAPFEDELAKISKELGDVRAEHDLKPSAVTILEKRLIHLEDIEKGVQVAFDKTEQGGIIKGKKQEMADLEKKKQEVLGTDEAKINKTFVQDEVSKIQNNIHQIYTKIQILYRDDKTAHEYAETIDKITQLKTDASWRLQSAKDASYDKNGIDRIK